MAAETQSCSFSLDPDAADYDHPAGELPDGDIEDGEWTCPHESLDGSDRCLIHLDPGERPADIDETAWFLNAIEASERQDNQRTTRHRKQFIGGRFRNLDLGSTVIDGTDNYPLDFRYAHIGTLDCSDVTITHDIDLGLARVSGTVSMDGKYEEIRGVGGQFNDVVLDGVEVETVDFRDACIDTVSIESGTVERCDFRHAAVRDFDGGEATFDRVNFDFATVGALACPFAEFGMVDFDSATFELADFYFAEFGQADFRGIAMDEAVFKGVDMDGGYFNESSFGISNWIGFDTGNAYFNGSTFDEVSFRGCGLGSASFPDCHFGWANFQEGELGDADFSKSTLEQVSFRGATFEGMADFRDIDVAGALNCRDTVFEDLRIRPDCRRPPGDALIALDRSEIPDGVLEQPDSGRAIYDLRDAVVGDIAFENGTRDDPLIDKIRFLRTEFDGFDFRDSDDLDLKPSAYAIHRMFDGAETLASRLLRYGLVLTEIRTREEAPMPSERTNDDGLRARAWDATDPHGKSSAARPVYSEIPPGDLETTYLLAKNGANARNDNEPASQFFIREMRQRRYQHAGLFADADTLGGRVRHATNWIQNGTLGMTSGYGERPGRVIYTSAAIISVFTGIYYALAPNLYPSAADYAILSIGSFVTLVVGRAAEIPVTSLNLLSQIEAFLGAFLIALFVFTLTRSIHR
ncbi:pentapeptide repeat-containing protein [Natronomonas halophila]|uniref:pentapeptide repeat-containing protein n=1 Tax=Natronomonas halophila TaxID=2747817 RepID=UPI0015B782FE|nr:pentapeptide repeat-containing protein [Natronomonas halophila]QLD84367.1 pentapeptide repeat-containing protein [Natronomonas halophila]